MLGLPTLAARMGMETTALVRTRRLPPLPRSIRPAPPPIARPTVSVRRLVRRKRFQLRVKADQSGPVLMRMFAHDVLSAVP